MLFFCICFTSKLVKTYNLTPLRFSCVFFFFFFFFFVVLIRRILYKTGNCQCNRHADVFVVCQHLICDQIYTEITSCPKMSGTYLVSLKVVILIVAGAYYVVVYKSSMEAILACCQALSTEWLDWVAILYERWRNRTGPILGYTEWSNDDQHHTLHDYTWQQHSKDGWSRRTVFAVLCCAFPMTMAKKRWENVKTRCGTLFSLEFHHFISYFFSCTISLNGVSCTI